LPPASIEDRIAAGRLQRRAPIRHVLQQFRRKAEHFTRSATTPAERQRSVQINLGAKKGRHRCRPFSLHAD